MKLAYTLKNIIKKINIEAITTEEIDSIVTISTTPVSDYIVEQGTSGIWTYRKWNSGIAECWGKTTTTLSNTGTVWTSPVYAYLLSSVNYPFTFTSVPTEFASQGGSSANSYWLYKAAGTTYDNTTTKTAQYQACKINSFTNGSTITVSYMIKGRWK